MSSACALLLAIASFAQAQRIPDAPSCAACSISVERIAVVGDEDQGAVSRSFIALSSDARLRIWYFGGGSDLLPMVFTPTGKFIAQVGRLGRGPGEMHLPMGMFSVPGDTTAIIDFGRIILLDASFKPARTIRLDTRGEIWGAVVVKWPSHVIVNANFVGAGREGMPLHQLDMTTNVAKIQRSFSHRKEILLSRDYGAYVMQYYLARDGQDIWGLSSNDYEITKWSADGRPVRRLNHTPAWFPGRSDWSLGSAARPPSPRLIGLSFDRQALLWIIADVAAPGWAQSWKIAPARGQESRSRDPDLFFRSRIDVVDVTRGRLVTSRTLDYRISTVFDGARIARAVERSATLDQIEVYQMRLVRR